MSSWTSWVEFAAMGDHGFYVWGSLAVCAASMAFELLWLRGRRLALLKQALPQAGLEEPA